MLMKKFIYIYIFFFLFINQEIMSPWQQSKIPKHFFTLVAAVPKEVSLLSQSLC